MRRLLIILFYLPSVLFSQEKDFISIHQEQSQYYSRFDDQGTLFFDSLNSFSGKYRQGLTDTCQLNRLVFGFHPYWTGSAYLNYRWNLLSDICFFSYEVDPSTGDPLTTHGWMTEPVIDSAQANDVRTHLCATLFSGHYTFFEDPLAQQNLIDNLIALVQLRNANGVNIDFEAVPSALGEEITVFIQDLSEQFHVAVPGGILSLDIPAVDWSEVFDINSLKDHVDLFVVMGYDYYWNGSGTAGPVGPLYSMTDFYDYSLCRTISAYQSKGIPNEKFILGLPYYGRIWKTLSNSVPSGTVGYGTALTYANVRNNSGGNFSPENYFWEGNSFSSCYIYFENGDWQQCFMGLDRDLKKRYDLVNYRSLAGIGIWALGYDNGYDELWDAIRSRFSDCSEVLSADTVYDCGGPSRDYYNEEDYNFSISLEQADKTYLDFRSFSLEEGFDSLYVYTGADSMLTLIGSYSGNESPGILSFDDGSFTLRFHSDGLSTSNGWEAIWHDGSLGLQGNERESVSLMAYPNPFYKKVKVLIPERNNGDLFLKCYDMLGRSIPLSFEGIDASTPGRKCLNLAFSSQSNTASNVLFLEVWDEKGQIGTVKLIIE